MSSATSTEVSLPMWRRIVNFPLVAMLIALIAVLGTLALLSVSLNFLMPGSLEGDIRIVLRTLIAVLAVLVVSKLVLPVLGEDRRDDLPFDGRLSDLLKGTFFAAVLMTTLVILAWLVGVYEIVGWGGSTSMIPILFGAGLSAGFIEEVIFRGILFRFLEQFGGSWFALAVSSLLFGFAHAGNDNATLFSSFAIAIEAGLLLGGAYMVTRNLWFAVGLHFGWNVVQGYIWDVAVSGNDVDGLVEARMSGPELVSGGAFGLEASVIALTLATLFGVYFVWLAYQRGDIVRPWWTRRRLARRPTGKLA